jgi:hypothetical protein
MASTLARWIFLVLSIWWTPDRLRGPKSANGPSLPRRSFAVVADLGGKADILGEDDPTPRSPAVRWVHLCERPPTSKQFMARRVSFCGAAIRSSPPEKRTLFLLCGCLSKLGLVLKHNTAHCRNLRSARCSLKWRKWGCPLALNFVVCKEQAVLTTVLARIIHDARYQGPIESLNTYL